MKIIVGLGNPEAKYEKTRHNAGFILLDEVTKNQNLGDFSTFQSNLICKNEKYILVKPQTYMNSSGIGLREIVNFYKVSTDDILLVYDEANIDVGKYKISLKMNSGGHNGIKSILRDVGNCLKLRIGVCSEHKKNIDINDFVLSNFAEEDLKTIKSLSNVVWEIISDFINGKDSTYLMNKFNR